MFGLTRTVPCCLNQNCKAETKLSMAGYCADCAWALSQRKELGAARAEADIATAALRDLDDAVSFAEAKVGDTIRAAKIEGQILLERNIKLKADLVKSYRKIKQLEVAE